MMSKAEIKLEDIGVNKMRKQTTVTGLFLSSASTVMKFSVVFKYCMR